MSYSTTSLTTRQRSRLSHSDVKLILYLIAQIKPFKYVGDRTLSQSRKWDLIQQKFERYKLNDGSSTISVPTVRTLQRQMATALRKAQMLELSDPPRPPFEVFQNLSLSSPLADLERAVLELSNVSEAYKTGQTVGPLPDIVNSLADMSPELGLGERGLDSPASQHTSDSGDESVELESVPVSVAPLIARLRDLEEENAAFCSEFMTMLRQHSTRMAEKYASLEMLLTSASNVLGRASQHAEAPRSPKDTAIHAHSSQSAENESGSGSKDRAHRSERLSGSIQVLLN